MSFYLSGFSGSMRVQYDRADRTNDAGSGTHGEACAMQLGKHFTLAEMTHSQKAARLGLSNRPDAEQTENLRRLCTSILDPLRTYLGPVVVSSGYRSPRVNAAVGGAKTSQHVQGLAADILVPGHSVPFVISVIRKLNLPYDQLIDEFGAWTHVSWSPRPRGEVLQARRVDGRTVYTRVS